MTLFGSKFDIHSRAWKCGILSRPTSESHEAWSSLGIHEHSRILPCLEYTCAESEGLSATEGIQLSNNNLFIVDQTSR